MSVSKNNLAVIIGGSSGMGLATAQQLAAKGTDLIIIGRDTDKLKVIKAELSPLTQVETLSVDLAMFF